MVQQFLREPALPQLLGIRGGGARGTVPSLAAAMFTLRFALVARFQILKIAFEIIEKTHALFSLNQTSFAAHALLRRVFMLKRRPPFMKIHAVLKLTSPLQQNIFRERPPDQ